MSLPSRLNATPETLSVCPLRVHSSRPVAALQTRGPVDAGGGDPLPIGAEGDSPDAIRMPRQGHTGPVELSVPVIPLEPAMVLDTPGWAWGAAHPGASGRERRRHRPRPAEPASWHRDIESRRRGSTGPQPPGIPGRPAGQHRPDSRRPAPR